MRAYVYIDKYDLQTTLYLPATSNRPADEVTDVHVYRTDKQVIKSGWYRASAECTERGHWFADLGRRINPWSEAKRLEKLANENNGAARTASPGIAGFMQREAASTAAAGVQQQISRHFAALLAAVPEDQL